MDTQVHQQVGKHDEAIETLKEEFRLVRGELTEIRLLLAKQRGGWTMLAALCSLAGGAGALVWYVMDLVKR